MLASADEVGFKAYLDGLVGAIYAEDVQEAVSSLEGYFHYGLDLWGSASNAPFERGRFWVGDARLGDGRTLRGLRATDLFDLDHDVVVHFHWSEGLEVIVRVRLVSVDALTLTAEKGDFVLAHRATTIVCRFDWRLILAYWEERVRRLNWVTVAGLRQQLARTFEVLDVAASRSPK